MSKIKVLHLIPTLSSGGAERQLVNLVNTTSKEIVDHVVCAIDESYFFEPVIREAGYKVIKFDISGKHPFFKIASKFRDVIRDEKPDIVHSWLYNANVAARLAMVLGDKTPIITSIQSADYEPGAIITGGYNPHKMNGLKMIDKTMARLTKPHFVMCSEFVKTSYRENYGIDEDRTHVIYNSVDPTLMETSEADVEKLREEFAFPPDTFVYLNVGRLDPQKNHKAIFEAFRQVLEEAPNSVLLLAGIGSLDDKLKQDVKDLKISEKVLFLGRRTDIPALLAMADVFVFPSFFEGLPVALVEAMFKSKPCIASRIDVFKEVITDGETGLLIDPRSPSELKDAMIKLYEDKNLRRYLGENALRQVQSKFHSDTTARQWENLYQRIKN